MVPLLFPVTLILRRRMRALKGRPGPPSDDDGNDEWEGDAKEASPPAMGFVVQFDRTLAPLQHLIPRNDIKLLHYYMKCHNKLPGLRDGVILMRGHSDGALDAATGATTDQVPLLVLREIALRC